MRLQKPDDREVLLWAVVCLLFSALFFCRVIAAAAWLDGGWPSQPLCMALGLLSLGSALWFEQSWAKWWGTALAVAAIAIAAEQWLTGGFTWIGLIGAVCVAFAAWQLWQLPLGLADQRPFLSLVLLLREPRYLDRAILARLSSRAWGIPVEEGAEDVDPNLSASGSAWVVGEAPLFVCTHPKAVILVHSFSQPYFDDPDRVAEGMLELRARRKLLEHTAWVAVDVVSWLDGEQDLEEAYRLIARLLAELADSNCLAVIDPDADQLFVYDPDTETKLRSENPLRQLRQPYYAPILGVSDDDPRMQQAVSEARRRWPEFVAAFEQRDFDEQSTFMVKAPFRNADEVEFMWFYVEAIENQVIYGELGNSPANLPYLAAGDRVQVPVADLNDWMFSRGEQPVGGFTNNVLRDDLD